MAGHAAPQEITDSVLATLAGVPLHQAAARVGIQPADLADAVEVYRAAGQAAVESQALAGAWYQVRIQFADWNAAEHVAVSCLSPRLEQASDAGVISAWWFIRKAPCWRLRLQPGTGAPRAEVKEAAGTVLDCLVASGQVRRWWETVYEPETVAFGGPAGVGAAHNLFHADSRAILDYLRRRDHAAQPEPPLGRRELSVLLCGALLRGTGQDRFEQGDVWHTVTRLRPLVADPPAAQLAVLARDLRRLITADLEPAGRLFGPTGPLGFAGPWAAAFHDAGQRLAAMAADGTLQRGLRAVLAHHVIFHWNRLGLSAGAQSILARAACDAILNPPAEPVERSVDARAAAGR